MSMPGKLVLSTTPFSWSQQNSLLIYFLDRLVPTPALLSRYSEKTTHRFLQGQWARNRHWSGELCLQNREHIRLGWWDAWKHWVRQSNTEPVRAPVEQTDRTDCVCCVHITSVWQLCLSPGCLVMSQQPKERIPFFPPLLLHWKWQYNDHCERTHVNLTKTQSVKDQRKNRSHEPNHQNLLLTPLRLRRGTPKKHFHLKARQRHCMWHKKNSKTHEALTCERNMLQLCQILLFIFY